MSPRKTAEDFGGEYPSGKRLPAQGIMARSRRGPIGQTWWARSLVRTVGALVGEGRLDRGKSYARSGQVLWLDIAPGRVGGDVQGSEPRPYRSSLELLPFDDYQRAVAAQIVRHEPILLAGLLAGELPERLEELLATRDLSLLPREAHELSFDCSCPDWPGPCKHVAALVFLLAERLDEDPAVLLTLRGLELEDLLSAPGGTADGAGTGGATAHDARDGDDGADGLGAGYGVPPATPLPPGALPDGGDQPRSADRQGPARGGSSANGDPSADPSHAAPALDGLDLTLLRAALAPASPDEEAADAAVRTLESYYLAMRHHPDTQIP